MFHEDLNLEPSFTSMVNKICEILCKKSKIFLYIRMAMYRFFEIFSSSVSQQGFESSPSVDFAKILETSLKNQGSNRSLKMHF